MTASYFTNALVQAVGNVYSKIESIYGLRSPGGASWLGRWRWCCR